MMFNLPNNVSFNYEGGRYVLTDSNSINLNSFLMKKKVKLVSNLENKTLVKKAIKTSENEKMDLYKSIFGGTISSGDCNVAVSKIDGASAAYNKTDQFLRV